MTPAPWYKNMAMSSRGRHGLTAYDIRSRKSNETDFVIITTVWQEHPEDNPDAAEEAEKNANLIAAAPDLLSALLKLMPRLLDNGYCPYCGATDKQDDEWTGRITNIPHADDCGIKLATQAIKRAIKGDS